MRPTDPAVEQLEELERIGIDPARAELVQFFPRLRRPLERADQEELADALEHAAIVARRAA